MHTVCRSKVNREEINTEALNKEVASLQSELEAANSELKRLHDIEGMAILHGVTRVYHETKAFLLIAIHESLCSFQ